MQQNETIQNLDELEFAIFCIENVAAKLCLDPVLVYDAFTKQSNILNGYIVPCCDQLHTQSLEYIVEDILDVMREKSIKI